MNYDMHCESLIVECNRSTKFKVANAVVIPSMSYKDTLSSKENGTITCSYIYYTASIEI